MYHYGWLVKAVLTNGDWIPEFEAKLAFRVILEAGSGQTWNWRMQVWYVDNRISEKYVCPTGRPILKIMVWIYGFSDSNVIVLDSTVPLDHFLYPPLIMNQCGVESCPIQMFSWHCISKCGAFINIISKKIPSFL